MIEVDPSTRTVSRESQPIELAPKEFDLLLALLRAHGAVVSPLAADARGLGILRRCTSAGPLTHTSPNCAASWKRTPQFPVTSSPSEKPAIELNRERFGFQFPIANFTQLPILCS